MTQRTKIVMWKSLYLVEWRKFREADTFNQYLKYNYIWFMLTWPYFCPTFSLRQLCPICSLNIILKYLCFYLLTLQIRVNSLGGFGFQLYVKICNCNYNFSYQNVFQQLTIVNVHSPVANQILKMIHRFSTCYFQLLPF